MATTKNHSSDEVKATWTNPKNVKGYGQSEIVSSGSRAKEVLVNATVSKDKVREVESFLGVSDYSVIHGIYRVPYRMLPDLADILELPLIDVIYPDGAEYVSEDGAEIVSLFERLTEEQRSELIAFMRRVTENWYDTTSVNNRIYMTANRRMDKVIGTRANLLSSDKTDELIKRVRATRFRDVKEAVTTDNLILVSQRLRVSFHYFAGWLGKDVRFYSDERFVDDLYDIYQLELDDRRSLMKEVAERLLG